MVSEKMVSDRAIETNEGHYRERHHLTAVARVDHVTVSKTEHSAS
jgi:hypothetical protein